MDKQQQRQEDIRRRASYYLALYLIEEGEVITIKNYEQFRKRHRSAPSVYHVSKAFGTWREGCEKAGLRVGVRYSRAEIFDALGAAMNSLGNNMTVAEYRQWARANGAPSMKVFITEFGSWSNALWAYDMEQIEAWKGGRKEWVSSSGHSWR